MTFKEYVLSRTKCEQNIYTDTKENSIIGGFDDVEKRYKWLKKNGKI